jgi:hypothetical protein
VFDYVLLWPLSGVGCFVLMSGKMQDQSPTTEIGRQGVLSFFPIYVRSSE